jgi:tRNA(Ile)-lysidine synthetase-like protein
VSDLSIVQQDVEATAELHDEMERMIRRFRKATNRRMAILQDETRRTGKLGAVSCCDGEIVKGGGEVEEEQILECFPFDADMSTAGDHVVVKTMKAFLCKMNILQICDAQTKVKFPSRRTSYISCPDDSSVVAEKAISDHIPTVIVSLSGGVDSMVIASSLAHLRNSEANRRNKHPDTILRIVGIHIDYGNRPESAAEASYVGKYCQTIGAKFVCRRIDEVTRGITARDDYERIAREIRFDLYRQYCAEARDGTEEDGIGIMLGHHRGDLRENVISNAHKGCGPLDLSGMTVVSKNDGVTLFRPLLSLEKIHIFDYSHKFGVPYFKDTTPHWSTRGKLRNRLLPLLEEIYGEGSMDHLSSLAEESDEARALVEETIMSPFMHQIQHYPMGFSFETSQWKDYSLFFWKIVLRKTMHSSGLGMFSDKSVDNFLDRVRAKSVREGWLQCRRDYAVYLQVDGRVFVFYPSSFPFGNGKNESGYDNSVEFLGYGLDQGIKVGPWTVKSEVIEVSDDVAKKLLNTKVFKSVEQLMSGDIQYHLNVPVKSGAKEPRPLVRVTGFTKFNRPTAWKGVDLKVETTLPLLGVDQSVISDADISGHQDNDMYALVRVHLLIDAKTKHIRTSRETEKKNGAGASTADIPKQSKAKYIQPKCTITINKDEELMMKEQGKQQSGGDKNSVAKATKRVDEESSENRPTASASHPSFDDDYDGYDGYDDYDDFGLNFGGVGGGGRTKKSNKSGGVYSTKHIRLVEARSESGGGHVVVGNANAKKSTK